MTKVSQSVAGAWRGRYTYWGGKGLTTPFLAKIDDNGVRLTGEMIEPEANGGIGSRKASIVGTREGTSIKFTKSRVDYVGRVSTDGRAISGVWSFLPFDGTFGMHREADVPEDVEEPTTVAEPEIILAPVSDCRSKERVA